MENKKTLDQIRVAVALKAKGEISRGSGGGDKIKNFPTMIQNNGLLGALAYASEGDGKKNPAEYSMAQKGICSYLNKLSENDYTVTENKNLTDPKALVEFLVECSPEQFRRINSEVLAFMNYFRRFAS